MLQEAKRIISKSFNSIEEFCESKHLPITYSVECEIMNDLGQMEHTTFVISRYRIFLFPQRMFSSQADNYKEFSILSIQSFFLGGPNLYHLILKNGDFLLINTSENVEPLIKTIIGLIEPINYHSKKPFIIQIGGFKKDYIMKSLKYRPELQSNIRYEAICSIYRQQSNSYLTKKFTKFEKTQRTFISFTQEAEPIVHPCVLSFPLITETNLSFIQFKRLCPNMVCSVVSHIMKYSEHLTTVIFEDYPDLKVEQLNFLNLKNPSVVSWHFRNCFFKSHDNLIRLFRHFSLYQGDIQTLQLDRIYIDTKIATEIDYRLDTSHCFKSLEILSLINLDISEVEVHSIFQMFLKRIQSLQSILYFSFTSQWSTLIQLDDSFKLNSSTLQSLVVQGMNLINTPVFTIPQNMTNLEFKECYISPAGLCNIVKSISLFKNDICLNIRDFIMEKSDWSQFEEMFSKLPPLTNLLELDWSGNPIPETFVNDFIRVFLNLEKIRFLAISRVFKTNELSRFSEIIGHLSSSRIWGLEIEGLESDENYQYGDAILVLILQLGKIASLEHLNINNHFFTEETFDLLSMSIKNEMKMIHEIMMDGTKISTPEKLFTCYLNMLDMIQPREVYRPVKDFQRLIFSDNMSDGNNRSILSLSSPSHTLSTYPSQPCLSALSTYPLVLLEESEKMIEFRSAMMQTRKPSTKLMRSSFYHFSSELNPGFSDYMKFCSPTIDLNIAEDPLNLTPYDVIVPRSLHDINGSPFYYPFGTYQAFLIDSPFKNSKQARKLPPFKIPSELAKYKKFKPHIDVYYVDDLYLIQPDQVMNVYEKLVAPKFLKTIENIEKIMEIFKQNGDQDSETFEFEKDFKKPPLFVSKAAIDFMKHSCLMLQNGVNQSDKEDTKK
ncbi:hypothetical protein M9Y10_045913 [Tritrichomonas musculus]|uniref:Leucine Rich Repeat family protein n=1 Tax=Tritrichomonas musculus TaxID=1915356 RepID=A0ABR2JYC9_9EUKA